MSLITEDSFRCASSSSFSQRSFCAVRIWTSLRRYAEIRIMPSSRAACRPRVVAGVKTPA
jgi:hypothetical protein